MKKLALKIVCSASLQSWRNSSLGPDFRPTELLPTKSGINGMIACARGLERNDDEIENQFNKFEMYVDMNESMNMSEYFKFLKNPKEKDINRDIYITNDYHTVSSKAGMITADGTILYTASITNREYISGYRYVVYLLGEENDIDEFKNALENPVWSYYFGSKCCIPAEEVVEKIITEDEFKKLYSNDNEKGMLSNVLKPILF